MSYTKSLEEQNEELQQKLAECQEFRPQWVKDDRDPPSFMRGISHEWWYLVMGKSTILAAVHHVKDIRIEGYKICILKTELTWRPACNVDPSYYETATTDTLQAAQRYCEERLLNG
jgi:hypothetical protein